MVFAQLTHGLADRGYKVDLVLSRAVGPALSQVHPTTSVWDLKASRSLIALPRLARWIRRQRPAALLSGLEINNVIALLARSLSGVPVRVVVSVHTTVSTHAAQKGDWQHRSLRRILPLAYPRADGIVAVSDGVADDLAAFSKLDRRRITRIYNPISPAISELCRAPCEIGGGGTSPVLLGVGRLVREKAFDSLIFALARVRKRLDASLVILGDGPERPRLQGLARELDLTAHVRFPGHVENPFSYMRAASLLVLSSGWEGFGNVLAEALACGTPVVSTDCPYGPREILAGGKYGRLVAVGDPAALADAIEAALSESPDRDELRRRARDFDLATITEQYLQVLLP